MKDYFQRLKTNLEIDADRKEVFVYFEREMDWSLFNGKEKYLILFDVEMKLKIRYLF